MNIKIWNRLLPKEGPIQIEFAKNDDPDQLVNRVFELSVAKLSH